MAWVIGIDEAGYGPNLGPLVQAAVAVDAPDNDCLWNKLAHVVRRAAEPDDGRLVIDDSKLVYAGHDFVALQRGVLTAFGFPETKATDEPWAAEVLDQPAADDASRSTLTAALQKANVALTTPFVVVTPARQVNSAIDAHGTKAAATANGIAHLLRSCVETYSGSLSFVIDKQGGRHYYAAFLQSVFPERWIHVVTEVPTRSEYTITDGERELRFVFVPKADSNHMPVALASMTAKYIRERAMQQFNSFWRRHVPDLAPTAGYPGDALRYFKAIRAPMRRLGIAKDVVWRKK